MVWLQVIGFGGGESVPEVITANSKISSGRCHVYYDEMCAREGKPRGARGAKRK